MTLVKTLIKSYIFYLTTAFGISLTIKANIGVSSFNAMNVALSEASSIKVGTITIALNMFFLIAYMIASKFKHKEKYIIQAISSLIFGFFINFISYEILGNFVVENYGLKVLTMVLGTMIGGASAGLLASLNAITFPIESFCLELSDQSNRSFAFYRYGVDVFSVTVSLLVSFAFNLPLYVREGTIISMVLLTFSMSFVRNRVMKYLDK